MSKFDDHYYNIGKLVNTQGIKGEVKVQPITDFPTERFKVGNTLWAFPNNFEPMSLKIDGVRMQKGFVILHFNNINSINKVEELHLKPSMLKIPEEEVEKAKLEVGEYYYNQIIGLEVFDSNGVNLGKIKRIIPLASNDVWVVEKKDKSELLLPKIDEVIKKIDLQKKKIIISLMEGME